MEIRRYRPEDHDQVWGLHNEALNVVGAHAGNGAWDDDLHRIEAHYLSAGGEFLVGVASDGALVAMGALERTAPDSARIRRMRVRPSDQRRGYGRRILTALEARAAELGIRHLHLDTTTVQHGAQRLYESAGYREVGRGKLLGFDTIFYEKFLAGSIPPGQDGTKSRVRENLRRRTGTDGSSLEEA